MSKRRCVSSPRKSIEVSPHKRYFLDISSVSRHLYCSICQEVFTEPQRAPCGHSYCKVCITSWFKQSQTCPEDRRPVKLKDLHHDFILENIIGDQKVACPFRAKGCEHICQLEQLASHKKKCTFNPENLPEFLREESTSQSSPKEKNSPVVAAVETDETSDSDDNEDKVPEPAFPSLKMRLFASNGPKKEMLCSMFGKTKGKKS